jgi:serine/threonine protein kinase
MKTTRQGRLNQDPRVLQAARAYLADLEECRQPDRSAYVNQLPEFAQALGECFDAIQLVHRAAQLFAPEPAPPLLGDFQILREIGRGGMGVVHEAIQLTLGRRVAIKVLPFAAGLDAKHLQRFKTESHAAAQLHHTNIVPVYAVGCERGLHYYAMQLIEGRSLEAVIRELRGPEGTPTALTLDGPTGTTLTGAPFAQTSAASNQRRENLRTAANLAAQVAEALDYAHEAGIIHRDIKPANLLLDEKGKIWVTDFGLAHVNGDASLTVTGDVVGTLRYMSPEQASGQQVVLDQRTDVYSLGATLYELLTLTPIFSGPDRGSLFQQILNQAPRAPRQINRSIPVDLETIVLKAVAKTPGERYTTAGEMAADLRRFLERKPILARRPSVFERTTKWLRRHPFFVAATVFFLLVGIAGLAATTALVAREQARTKEAYQSEQKRANEAEARFYLARRAADDLIQVAEEELAHKPQLEGVRKQMLQAALSYYQALIEHRREDPGTQAELAITRDRIKQVVADLAVLQGMGQIYLLEKPAVLDELKTTAPQRQEIATLLGRQGERRHAFFKGFHRLSAEQRRHRFLEMARSNDQALRSVLGTKQLKRLGQLALQSRGLAAFQEPEVVSALKLKSKQRQQLREIEANLYPWGPGAAPRWDKSKQKLKAALEKSLALLTPQQQKCWRDLIGSPLEGGDFSPMRPGK